MKSLYLDFIVVHFYAQIHFCLGAFSNVMNLQWNETSVRESHNSLKLYWNSVSTKILQPNKCKIYEQEPLNNDTCLYVQCNLWVSQRLNVCDEHRKLSWGTLGWYLVIHFDNQW